MDDEKYETYLFSYHHDGREWSFDIKAKSMDDARDRVRKLPMARYDGVLVAKIPAGLAGAGWFVRLWCWLRNQWVNY